MIRKRTFRNPDKLFGGRPSKLEIQENMNLKREPVTQLLEKAKELIWKGDPWRPGNASIQAKCLNWIFRHRNCNNEGKEEEWRHPGIR